MTLKERTALALAGYKKKEIEALIEEETQASGNGERDKDSKPGPESEPEIEPKNDQGEPEGEPSGEPAGEPEGEPAIDYEKLYNNTLQQLKAAQAENSARDIALGEALETQTIISEFLND